MRLPGDDSGLQTQEEDCGAAAALGSAWANCNNKLPDGPLPWHHWRAVAPASPVPPTMMSTRLASSRSMLCLPKASTCGAGCGPGRARHLSVMLMVRGRQQPWLFTRSSSHLAASTGCHLLTPGTSALEPGRHGAQPPLQPHQRGDVLLWVWARHGQDGRLQRVAQEAGDVLQEPQRRA